MKYKKVKDPVCDITIHLLACTEEELLAWSIKHMDSFDIEDTILTEAMVFSTINDNDEPLVWFRTKDTTECLSVTTVAHETFHLWHFMKSKMVGGRMLLLDVSNSEYDAYHFQNLFRMVTEFAFSAFEDQMSFPKHKRSGGKLQMGEKPVVMEDKPVTVEEKV
jgi:hypothetical protein